ncbi:hypothetical protein [Bacillus xiapuensis]|uniref:hypothetical protein n=1 Tax=Bacillus xiapuensis TaxID=2014075 RepID=UPI001E4D5E4C|nr:hypothetical protein [Bacillus xiapuensis]
MEEAASCIEGSLFQQNFYPACKLPKKLLPEQGIEAEVSFSSAERKEQGHFL